jgi:serine phosphatase RsbU (regulator of sigma subunit)
MFSDGYVDQFGGPQGRKYMKKRFKEFLHSIHKEPMNEQRRLLNEEMFKWMDGQEQIDDQIVIGMRLVK